jgi:hypothetical protein
MRTVRSDATAPETPVAGAMTIGVALLGLTLFVVERWLADRAAPGPAQPPEPTGQETGLSGSVAC